MKKIFTQIVIANAKRESALSKFACKSSAAIRLNPDMENIPDRVNIRPAFFHDTDRILHSSAYTRYIDKTQVFYLFENDHITHRALHVQLVSKIARVIGRALSLNEDLIEAISLGHDIGHVPFGHDGERFLNDICKINNIGCFCHNAQSVKFLMEIENRGKGLNLSLQVLDGILAHNGEILSREYIPLINKNKDEFLSEYKSCFIDEAFSKKIVPMTLEGCIVRISDVIAYIGRDIEDAITLKILKREAIPKKITNVLGNNNKDIINRIVLDLIKNSYNKGKVVFSKNVFNALNNLKKFNEKNIYNNSSIRSENIKIEKFFFSLYEQLLLHAKKGNKQSSILKDHISLMPNKYRSHYQLPRQVVDYISGMTDDYFRHLCEKYFVPQSYGYSLPQKIKE